MEIITDNPDEPIVVFSQFKSILVMLARRLEKKGISYGITTGDIKKAERTAAVQDFQAGKLQVFMGTIATAGEGITLTRASTVVFLDRAWRHSANRQAEDRLHRIGQEEAVQVIDLIARNTVDLGRLQKIERKAEWVRQLVGDPETVQRSLV
jgi:SNF2 family DNA or RNA helicase